MPGYVTSGDRGELVREWQWLYKDLKRLDVRLFIAEADAEFSGDPYELRVAFGTSVIKAEVMALLADNEISLDHVGDGVYRVLA